MIKNKMFCIKCNKYRKFKNIKIPYIFDKKLVLSIICNRCSTNEGYIFKVLYIYIFKMFEYIYANIKNYWFN